MGYYSIALVFTQTAERSPVIAKQESFGGWNGGVYPIRLYINHRLPLSTLDDPFPLPSQIVAYKAPSMKWTWSVSPECGNMCSRTIALMALEAILRIAYILLDHITIARNFCKD